MQPCHIVVIHDILCTCGAHQQHAPLCLIRMMGYERWQPDHFSCQALLPLKAGALLWVPATETPSTVVTQLNCTNSLVHFGFRNAGHGQWYETN